MRWQDELASRASLSAQPRTHTGLGSASFNRPPTATPAKSDSQASASIPVPVRPVTPTFQPDTHSGNEHRPQTPPVQVKQTSSKSTPDAHDKLQQDMPSGEQTPASQCDPSTTLSREATQEAGPVPASAPASSSSHAEQAVLARLPSAKGHHLVSYASSLPGRPASPMKNPNTPGDLLGNSALSVRTLSMQVPECHDVCLFLDPFSSSTMDHCTDLGMLPHTLHISRTAQKCRFT